MKHHSINRWCAAAAAVVLGVGVWAPAALAGEVIVSQFDTAEQANWGWENWSDQAVVSWDETLNAGGGADPSGSMRVVNNFTKGANDYSQAVITLDLRGNVDAETLYRKISLDVRVDPSSALRASGTDYGALEVIFRNGPNWDWNSLGAVRLTSTDWVRLEFNVKAPGDKLHHLTLKLGENGLTNTVIYNVDNIVWTETDVEIPPPTLNIEKPELGLHLNAGAPGQYDRQNIKTALPGLGWVGASGPVSYSFTLKSFPNATTYAGFQSHVYLVPGSPGTEEYPDWTEPTVVYIAINGNANGGGTATFRYKTNAPNSNGPGGNGYFNTDPANGFVGQLGGVTSASVLGTWTFTFSENTKITLTGPDGTSTTVNMPADDAALFTGDITAYFGVMPGQDVNRGQTAILSGAKITVGDVTMIDETFSNAPLDSTVWTINASLPAAVSLVASPDTYFVWWTTPASGYTLQAKTAVNAPDWLDLTVPDALIGTKRRAVVSGEAVPSVDQGFYRLMKPDAQ